MLRISFQGEGLADWWDVSSLSAGEIEGLETLADALEFAQVRPVGGEFDQHAAGALTLTSQATLMNIVRQIQAKPSPSGSARRRRFEGLQEFIELSRTRGDVVVTLKISHHKETVAMLEQGCSIFTPDETGRVLDRLAGLGKVVSSDAVEQALISTGRVGHRRCHLSHEVMLWIVLARPSQRTCAAKLRRV